jgi:hypothetical protein
MSRSGYSDCLDDWELAMWRGAVTSAIRGKRGQALLRDLRDALDSMPGKRLIAEELVTPEGDVCALGRLAEVRGLDVSEVDPEDPWQVASIFNIARALAAEIEYKNDECGNDWKWTGDGHKYSPETPEKRWQRMRKWVDSQIIKEKAPV